MKKLLSFLIAVLMASSIVFISPTSAGASEASNISSDDVINSRELMASVGIVPSFATDNDSKVSRADFVVTLMALLKLNTTIDSENCFYDVSTGDSFNSAINHALNIGIISEGQYFHPHDAVTYAQACKMLTITLGYNSHALAKGGYPYGYVAIASQIDLNSKINPGANDTLSGATACILLANALEADMLIMDSVISDGNGFLPAYGAVSNILYTVHGLYEIEGIVSANDVTNIYDPADICPEGFIMAGDTKYKCDYQVIPGTRIRGYAQKSGQTETIRYLTYDNSSLITLYSGCDISFDGKKISYTAEDGKEKSITADKDYSVVYNGKAYPSFKPQEISPQVGKVIAVDSDDDGDCDVINIYSAQISQIDIVNSDTSVVADSFMKVSYDLNDKDKFRIFSNGERVSSGAVTKGSVLEVYTSKDNSLCYMNILTETLSGTIEEKGNNSLWINSHEYEYTSYFASRYMTDSDIGSSNSFVLTSCGKIAASSLASEVSGMLGYAYKFAMSGGIDNTYRIMIFTEEGNHIAYETANKIKLNDTQTVTPETLSAHFKHRGETIIRYSTNADGKINSVIFPEEKASTTQDSIYVPGTDSKDILKPYVIEGISDSTNITYKIFGIFTPHFMISDDTKIFCIDSSADNEDNKYIIGNTSTWENDSNIPLGAMEIYNVTSIGRAGVLVVRHSASSSLTVSRSLLGGVVESISKSIDPDGEEALKVVLYSKGYQNLYIPKNTSTYTKALNELDYGDFIVYSKDKNNNILEYDKDFDFGDGDILHSSGGDNDGLSYYYGTLDEADEKAFSVDLIDSSTSTKSKMCVVVREDGGITSLANADRKVISGLSYSQLPTYKQQGYEVLVRTYCAEPFQIVIYKR